jgi:hypothetical protein
MNTNEQKNRSAAVTGAGSGLGRDTYPLASNRKREFLSDWEADVVEATVTPRSVHDQTVSL